MALEHPKIAKRTIDSFKSKLVGGGARPNLFEVMLTFPQGVNGPIDEKTLDEKTRFMVKAANLPASNITPIDIPFRGRNLKIAGDRTFDVWTVTVINDTDFAIRNAMERWMNGMNNLQNATGETNPVDYQTDAYVLQLGRGGKPDNTGTGKLQGPGFGDEVPVLKQYKFHGIFPTNISAIELSYDQPDTIEEFTVDLQVQWWDALDPEGKSLFGITEGTVPTSDG
tara:strand:- start:60 stop:734 length:675 start_codon:yes stop_codon:yes gene_type:complete